MRKLIFTVVLFAAFGFNTAQNKNKIVNPKHITSAAKSTADSDCAIFLKLAELAADDNLASIKGIAVKSRYNGSYDLFTSSLPVPGTVETLIDDDPDDGAVLKCIVKNYGNDETAARANFDAQLKRFTDCLPSKQKRVTDAINVFIRYKNCTININTYRNGGVNAWVMLITMEYSRIWF